MDIGKYWGIPVKVHWSFMLVFVFILYISYSENLSLKETATYALYILFLFLSVLLHEYGHALMARKYGVPTRDIILTPIGGVARLEYLPAAPKKELMITMAGPAVNLVIAGLVTIVLYALGVGIILPDAGIGEILSNPIGFLTMLLFLNLILFAFNLIPAFPMDGGRILRAMLTFFMDRLKATRIAMIVGRVLAIAFVGLGVYHKVWSIVLIGVFVYVTAGKEYGLLKANREAQIASKVSPSEPLQ